MQQKTNSLTPLAIIALLFLSYYGSAQTNLLPADRATDWSLAGLIEKNTDGYDRIDMSLYAIHPSGDIANDEAIQEALSDIPSNGAYLIFPEGEFLFNESIRIESSNVVIKGQGAEKTTFKMDLGGSENSIHIEGELGDAISSLTQPGRKGSHLLKVENGSLFTEGDWIRLIMDDSEYIYSDWALNTVGQMARIERVQGSQITLRSPLRIDIKESNAAYIQKADVLENIGIECIKILRVDDTAPLKTCNVFMQYAVNSWVTGIESENTTFSHFDARYSSNLLINKSYFHHAHGYGGGGRAYGVTVQYSSNECLIENNIFEHLRHAILLQAGANGNVFSYNYTSDQTWDSWPAGAGGDIAIHGNYPFMNLIEQNICENIVLDFSHGDNGPYNTFFRNRAEGYGLRFSTSNSSSQNIIGTEVTNNFLTIRGDDHLLHGNNENGTVTPIGTEELTQESLFYSSKPDFVSTDQWAGIGPGNELNENSIPARDRFLSNSIFDGACESASTVEAQMNIISPSYICIGKTARISAETNMTAATYEWSSNNEIISTQAELEISPSEVETMSITLTIRQGQIERTDEVTIDMQHCGLGIRITKESTDARSEERQVKSLSSTPLEGVQVSLWADTDADGNVDQTVGPSLLTDDQGVAIFSGIDAGLYVIAIDPINFETGLLAGSAPTGEFNFDPTIGFYGQPTEYGDDGTVVVTDQEFIPSTLPLEFVSFDATYLEKDQEVLLQWHTSNEVNTSHFIIQKSTDDDRFEDIGLLQSKADDDGSGIYSLVDRDISFTGDVLYRIQQVDQDGTSSYSDIRVVRVAERVSLDINIFPNPSSDYIVISASEELNSLTEIQLVDMQGRQMNIDTQKEVNEIRLDIQSLPEGMYVLHTSSNQDKKAFPVMIQR